MSWGGFFRRLAATCCLCGASAWSSAMCYAQLASDNASDPVYADGWQETDNGGFGFTEWNFDGSYPGIHAIDTGSMFNNIGTAWRLALTYSLDVARAGRGFDPLQPGQTIRVIVDNPTEQTFFRGYFVRFNTGGGNICYAGTPCTPGTNPLDKIRLQMFEYFTYGQWSVIDSGGTPTPLFDTDTDQGMQVDLTITGPDTYEITMTPLDDPSKAYTQSGTLDNVGMGDIDWIEFTFFNTDSDPEFDTDFYVRSIEIFAATSSGDFNGDGNFDCLDINALVAEIAAGSNDPSFDMTGDGNVNLDDRDAWLLAAGEHNLGPGRAYLLGDTNLDSFVDGLDFVEWNENKFTGLPEWCSGDFTADGFIDGLDFIEWNSNKFTGAGAGAVPEPGGSWATVILTALGSLAVRRCI